MRIRRCEDASPEGLCLYGVEFVELDRVFKLFLEERLRTGRPDEELWSLSL
ncbi:MAG TPA: hypothetical protein VIY72_05125 [Acidimicrobiales bacterium]